MFVYVFMVFTLLLLMVISYNNKISLKKRNKILFFTILSLIMIQGLRSFSVGVDLKTYSFRFIENSILSFKEIILTREAEWGYHILNKIISSFGGDFRVLLFITSISIFIPLYIILKRYSEQPFLSLLIFIFLGFFTFSLSGLRQTIAIGITLLSFIQIKNKKILKFLLIVTLATLFHRSAFIFYLAYPIYHFNLTKNKFYFLLIPISAIFIFRESIMIFLTSIYDDSYTVAKTSAYNFLLLLIFFLVTSLMFLYNKNDKDKKGLINLLIFSVVLQFFSSYSTIVMRFNYYYYIYLILLVPLLFESIKDKNLRFGFSSVTIMFLGLMFFTSLKGSVMQVYPYEFLIKVFNVKFSSLKEPFIRGVIL